MSILMEEGGIQSYLIFWEAFDYATFQRWERKGENFEKNASKKLSMYMKGNPPPLPLLHASGLVIDIQERF